MNHYSSIVDCYICLEPLNENSVIAMENCHHVLHKNCLYNYIKHEAFNASIEFQCSYCREPLHPNDLHWQINDAMTALMIPVHKFNLNKIDPYYLVELFLASADIMIYNDLIHFDKSYKILVRENKRFIKTLLKNKRRISTIRQLRYYQSVFVNDSDSDSDSDAHSYIYYY